MRLNRRRNARTLSKTLASIKFVCSRISGVLRCSPMQSSAAVSYVSHINVNCSSVYHRPRHRDSGLSRVANVIVATWSRGGNDPVARWRSCRAWLPREGRVRRTVATRRSEQSPVILSVHSPRLSQSSRLIANEDIRSHISSSMFTPRPGGQANDLL